MTNSIYCKILLNRNYNQYRWVLGAWIALEFDLPWTPFGMCYATYHTLYQCFANPGALAKTHLRMVFTSPRKPLLTIRICQKGGFWCAPRGATGGFMPLLDYLPSPRGLHLAAVSVPTFLHVVHLEQCHGAHDTQLGEGRASWVNQQVEPCVVHLEESWDGGPEETQSEAVEVNEEE